MPQIDLKSHHPEQLNPVEQLAGATHIVFNVPNTNRKIDNEACVEMKSSAYLLNVLQQSKSIAFGDFTLKSGDKSNYFVNFGQIHQAKYIQQMAELFALAIDKLQTGFENSGNSGLFFDILCGPAYKGIILGTATALQLHQINSARWSNLDVCFDRKEAKQHGEGGMWMGAAVEGKKLLVIDDVISQGTAKNQIVDLIKTSKAKTAGIIVGLNRSNRDNALSSADAFVIDQQIPLFSLLHWSDLQNTDGSKP